MFLAPIPPWGVYSPFYLHSHSFVPGDIRHNPGLWNYIESGLTFFFFHIHWSQAGDGLVHIKKKERKKGGEKNLLCFILKVVNGTWVGWTRLLKLGCFPDLKLLLGSGASERLCSSGKWKQLHGNFSVYSPSSRAVSFLTLKLKRGTVGNTLTSEWLMTDDQRVSKKPTL